MAVLNLTPAFAKVGVTSGFPEGKLTLREVAVQGWKVGRGLNDFCLQMEYANYGERKQTSGSKRQFLLSCNCHCPLGSEPNSNIHILFYGEGILLKH